MWDLFISRLSFASDAVIGVGSIVLYFCWMMFMAFARIKAGDHCKES